jgi:hypothetical protein
MTNDMENSTDQDGFLRDYDKIKTAAEELYSGLGDVLCPYLQEKVAFNAKGREHIKFKSKNKARPRKDQYMRLKLLRHAPEIIKLSRTVQGINKTRSFELIRSNQRNEKLLTDVVYYEFIAVIEERIRIRVVVKKVGEAPPYFWSIIPFWRRQIGAVHNTLHYGNSEID